MKVEKGRTTEEMLKDLHEPTIKLGYWQGQLVRRLEMDIQQFGALSNQDFEKLVLLHAESV